MTSDRQELPSKELFIVILNFLRWFTVHLGLISIGYGLLTFVFGAGLWGTGSLPSYQSALSVPMAPQSWGTFALTCGILMLIGEFTSKKNLLASSSFLQGIWCFTFASFFLFDSIKSQTSVGASGVWVYIAFGVIYLGRARLAWVWR